VATDGTRGVAGGEGSGSNEIARQHDRRRVVVGGDGEGVSGMRFSSSLRSLGLAPTRFLERGERQRTYAIQQNRTTPSTPHYLFAGPRSEESYTLSAAHAVGFPCASAVARSLF
jgi:hypothetical protein